MKRGAIVVAVLAALVGLSAASLADEKVDKAVKELDEQFAKVKSYSAKTETMTAYEFTPGNSQKAELVGTSEWLRKGDKALMRSDAKGKTATTQGGETTTTTSLHTTVDDGQFLYVLSEENDQKMVMKNAALPSKMYQPMGYFEQFKAYYDIGLLPDEKVDGRDCYVFEMKMKPMEGAPPSGRQLVYFWKDHGIQIKTEAFDGNGKLTVSSIVKDIKINANISEDRFKFEIPEGAQVMDNTGQQAPAAMEAESGDEEAAEEEEQPPAEGEKKKKGIKLPKWP